MCLGLDDGMIFMIGLVIDCVFVDDEECLE